jgi:hypothetical protein
MTPLERGLEMFGTKTWDEFDDKVRAAFGIKALFFWSYQRGEFGEEIQNMLNELAPDTDTLRLTTTHAGDDKLVIFSTCKINEQAAKDLGVWYDTNSAEVLNQDEETLLYKRDVIERLQSAFGGV